ncbi:Ribosome-recycling factor, chloroplastic, partial [Dichanthelium oligosanthes]
LTHATIEEIEAEKSVIEEQAKEKMEKAIETVQTNFNTVRTGRANPTMLDRIEVEYYGTPVNLKSIAQISTPDATSLLIQPYDKSSLKLIEKTIVAANLGVTPSNDGEVIRVTVPPLTSDRRKELAKTVAKLAEDGKVAVRNIRRDAIKAYDKLQKEKKLSEDNVKDLSADLQIEWGIISRANSAESHRRLHEKDRIPPEAEGRGTDENLDLKLTGTAWRRAVDARFGSVLCWNLLDASSDNVAVAVLLFL